MTTQQGLAQGLHNKVWLMDYTTRSGSRTTPQGLAHGLHNKVWLKDYTTRSGSRTTHLSLRNTTGSGSWTTQQGLAQGLHISDMKAAAAIDANPPGELPVRYLKYTFLSMKLFHVA